MFGFGDGDTPEVARLLFLKARDAARDYLPLSSDDLRARLDADFPNSPHWSHDDHAGFVDPELPDFSFEISRFMGDATLTIFGGGRFDGFMLQRGASGDHLNLDIKKPISRPLGPKAKRLGQIIQQQYGATNPRATLERHFDLR